MAEVDHVQLALYLTGRIKKCLELAEIEDPHTWGALEELSELLETRSRWMKKMEDEDND